MWAVTIIGAPKKWAAQAIEDLEKDARGWYGGAVGMIALDGDINTGITIRTIHLRDGVAAYGAGATLLYDSIPENEDRECAAQSHRFFPRPERAAHSTARVTMPSTEDGRGVRLLLVDNEDCFIHTLANYARQTGAEVITYRAGFPLEMIEQIDPSLILISPGPGRPSDFGVPDLVRHAAKLEVPVFGVCLGCKAWSKRSAANWACSIIRCTANRRSCGNAASAFSRDSPQNSASAAIIRSTRFQRNFRPAWK